MSFREKIDTERVPKHIAVIMDGNGRWAKEKGKLRVFGHQNGVKAVRNTLEAAAKIGVEYLTLYAFSTENWKRPSFEVTALMEILVTTINKETKTLMQNDIKLNAFGDLKSLPSRCYKELIEAVDKTKHNKRLTLNLALSYSSRWELVNMAQLLAEKVKNNELKPEDINEQTINSLLCTAGMPDPELLIRTSGEHRISNFLLWQIAYSELYFTDVFWPDFNDEHLYKAIVDYQQRERRFGMTSEQVI
ncbi:isoprenyl transferase [Solitalea koreensis]|uniref:Isoprenyl transferase n=1 Tax=Solitalea koreensis TaxID=543615 RepID=A0A521D0P0_9SPHI|nr:isoprenyl transferase [Solitalea koreensis]SMO65238.1 undecaprenyl diphosphate synthase [Solitalea koreensis]